MKVFDLNSETEYIVSTDENGRFVCPICKREILKLKELPYSTLNDGKTSPRSRCSCGADYWQPKNQ